MLSTGACAIIEAIQTEQLTTPETTYNFEVADFHTYYVGENSVCVHNKGCGVDLYRGGNDMTARDIDVKIKDGMVQPTRGISVNSNINAVAKFGQPFKLGEIPNGLQVVLTSGTHFEIIPAYAMPFNTYQNLLYGIPLIPII